MPGQRFAVQRPGQKCVGGDELFAGHAAPVLLLNRELLRPEFNLLLAAIGAEEDELARLRLEAAGSIEHCAQRHAGPSTVAAQPLKRSPIARTFEAGDEVRTADLAQFVE